MSNSAGVLQEAKLLPASSSVVLIDQTEGGLYLSSLTVDWRMCSYVFG